MPFPSKLKTILIFTQAHSGSPPSQPARPAWGPTGWAMGLRYTKGQAQPGPLTSQRAQWPTLGWAIGLTPPGRAARPGPLETLTWDDEISLDLIHNMLLMHEKRLEQQNLVEENIVVLVNLVST